MPLINVSERIFNTPLLIHPGKAEAILWGLGDRLNIEVPAPLASRFIGSAKREGRDRALSRASKGVALIDVYGTLVNRGAWVGAQSGLTSYEGLKAQIADAASDPEIKAICLVIDSPGGEAGGMKAVAETILEARASKRIVAVVDDMAASAAYGIASAANEIWISQTSTVGSIGVVLVHMDHSGELQMAGVRPTIIKAGAKKATGNPFEPLSDEAREELSQLVAVHYDAFLSTVAAGRGSKCSAKAARATEAAVFVGQEAITRGLADRMGTVEQAVEYLAKCAPRKAASRATEGASKMTDDSEVIMTQAEVAAMKAEAAAHGAKGERERISAIVRADAAKGRMTQALACALDTDMTAEQSRAVLSASPAGNTPLPSLSERMQASPTVGAPAADTLPADKPAGSAWGDVHADTARRMGLGK